MDEMTAVEKLRRAIFGEKFAKSEDEAEIILKLYRGLRRELPNTRRNSAKDCGRCGFLI